MNDDLSDELDKEKSTTFESDSQYNSGLRLLNKNAPAPQGSNEVEAFLKNVERELLQTIMEPKKSTAKDLEINSFCIKLQENLDLVIIPMDKTNLFQVVKTKDYTRLVKRHLEKDDKIIMREKPAEIKNMVIDLHTNNINRMGDNESDFMKESIYSRALPTPKLLIKDHKKLNLKGKFKTRLVVPVKNFTAGFSKLGYTCIKKIFDKEVIRYKDKTQIQALDLEDKRERLPLTKSNSSSISNGYQRYVPADNMPHGSKGS